MEGEARTFARDFSNRADKRASMQDIGQRETVDASIQIVDTHWRGGRFQTTPVRFTSLVMKSISTLTRLGRCLREAYTS
jgi:hypothetical protein